jgi:UDP-N-acetylmuramate dehydrogenase
MDLTPFNTLRLPSRAAHHLYCTELSMLAQLQQAQWRDMPWYVLGGGSNVVLPEKIEGLVIQVALQGKGLLREDKEAWYVKAYAGENWHAFVLWTLSQGYAGLENLALIPGTVGAAPVQNIGAYGVEIKDYLEQVSAYDLTTGEQHLLTAAECQLAYRDSIFKQHAGRFLITDVVLRLPKKPTLHIEYGDIQAELASLPLTPQHIAQAIIKIRQRKLPDPAKIGNVGSFFKNPIVSRQQAEALLQRFPTLPHYPYTAHHTKLAAGWLIEQAGWKGKRLGPVGMYEKQALVLVNHGGATAIDVNKLCTAVQRDVYTHFKITLEPEPIFW